MLRVDPPFPFQPKFSRMLGVQVVLDFEAEPAREILRAFAHDQMMVRLLHRRLRHERGRPHTFEAGHAAGTPFRAVHATGIELHHAVRVRQTAVADAVIKRIELDDVHARDERVEHVRAARGHHREGLLDAGHVAAVFEFVAVRRRDHDRLGRFGTGHAWCLPEKRARCHGESQSARDARLHETPSIHAASKHADVEKPTFQRFLRSRATRRFS
jgi:hypothetical protein